MHLLVLDFQGNLWYYTFFPMSKQHEYKNYPIFAGVTSQLCLQLCITVQWTFGWKNALFHSHRRGKYCSRLLPPPPVAPISKPTAGGIPYCFARRLRVL